MKKFILFIGFLAIFWLLASVAKATPAEETPSFADIRTGKVIGEFVNSEGENCYILELTDKEETWVLSEHLDFYVGIPRVGGNWHPDRGDVGFYLGRGETAQIHVKKIADRNTCYGLICDDRFKTSEEDN